MGERSRLVSESWEDDEIAVLLISIPDPNTGMLYR